jgi:hypothetical protein
VIFTQIASIAGTATTYSVTGLQPNTAYTFRVRASNATVSSAYSNTASATTAATVTGTLPSPWMSGDIGAPALSGSATYSNGTFTITGGGAGIKLNSDQFQYVDQMASGDLTIIAKVNSLGNTNARAKAGVMVRATSDAGSAFVSLSQTPGVGLILDYRTTAGSTLEILQGPTINGPVWLKLVRRGNTFTGSYSTDGVTYTALDPVTVSMAANVFTGLAVTGRDPTVTTTASFSSVSVTKP